MTPEEKALAFEAWDTGNRPPPYVEAALVRAIRDAKNQAYEEAAKVSDGYIDCEARCKTDIAATIRALRLEYHSDKAS